MSMQMNDAPTLKTGFRWPAILGVIVTMAFAAGAGGWTWLTEINGAVIAQGAVEVASRPKSVQHLDGGIIDEILVSNGDTVDTGDVLMRLDATLLAANLAIYQTRLAEATARRDRLVAEQEGRDTITWTPVDLPADVVDINIIRSGEDEIFRSRRELQDGRREQLAEKILQFDNQTEGVRGLITSKQDQLDLMDTEIAATQTLVDRGLARDSQLLGLLRGQADMLGQISEHTSELARIENSIRDTELEILQIDRQFREGVVTELRDATTERQELSQQIFSTEKQLERVEIRAPDTGRIHELQFSTIAGVVAPGAVILQIIPRDDDLRFELQIDPASVDQVFPGQEATIRFPAFNQRTTPELTGSVLDISPTSVIDEATGLSFYRVGVTIPTDELARLGDLELVPGMPVQAFLQTGKRTVFSYLTKPLTEQLTQAFREE
ncbi:HlyD family type I secretion periplasmic adaptor subunit [Yoonia sp. 208BN28-4]|uniref:HlyD family type I secretion periplasmic adaptor subunit n=1 Tax=Yoonia sp. 208BN28-4 TaxID=3126505 RepID=UPI0030A1AE39